MIDVSMRPFWKSDGVVLLNANALDGLRALPEGSVHCVVTSPPYLGLRNYGTEPVAWGGEPKCVHSWQEETYYRYSPVRTGTEGTGYRDAAATREQHRSTGAACVWCGAWRGELGLEPVHDCLAWARGEPPCPLCYVCHIRTVFRELWRVLRADGTAWLNIADCYNGSGGAGGDYRPGGLREGQSGYPGRRFPLLKPKNLTGIPWRCALALQADGWTLRSDIIWHKPNGMPQSVTDRPSSSHEHLLLLAKGRRYYYDADAVREPHSSVSVERARRGRRAGHKWEDGPGRQTIAGDAARALHPGGRNRRDVWTIATKPFSGAKLLADYVGADGRPYRASPDCPLHRHLAGARPSGAPGPAPDASPSARGGTGKCPCQTVSVDHFATFPPALVEPCILAGTSERGCCPKCGAPWRRVVERGGPLGEWRRRSGANRDGGYRGRVRKDYSGQAVQEPGAVKRRILEGMRERITAGWEPACPCGANEPEPCVVLDPFAGSGTTGAVALQYGRAFVGIELNPSYCELAAERIGRAAPARMNGSHR